jgi:hypothetical protein
MRRTAVAVVAALVIGSAGCGSSGDDDEATSETTSASATTFESTAADPLAGTWRSEENSCEEQEATVAREFTPEEVAASRFECHPETVTLRFQDGGLAIFEDEEIGWDGAYTVVDETTFMAGDDTPGAGMYITYNYSVDGDTLTIDMIQDDYPAAVDDAELLGERIAQTFIFETSAFTRVD